MAAELTTWQRLKQYLGSDAAGPSCWRVRKMVETNPLDFALTIGPAVKPVAGICNRVLNLSLSKDQLLPIAFDLVSGITVKPDAFVITAGIELIEWNFTFRND